MVILTTEEKLQHFLDFCMEDARSRSAKMLDEYTAALEQTFAEHQADARRRAEQQVELESERIEHCLLYTSPSPRDCS